MSKKKAAAIIFSVLGGLLIIAAVVALCNFPGIIGNYKNDTESNYISRIKSLDLYSNTLDSAVPQTDIYSLVNNFFNSDLPKGKTEKKAIILGYDGCRADALGSRAKSGAINTLIENGGEIKLSFCGGVNYPEQNTQKTSTAPGWSSILTGKWGSETGVLGNGIIKSTKYLSALTTLVEQQKADSSAFYTAWNGHFSVKKGTYNDEKKYCEENGLNVKFEYSKTDELTQDKLINDVKSDDCTDFIFSIYESTDHSGHSKGFLPTKASYQDAVKVADTYAKDVIDTIKSRKTFESENWLIIITADHGGYKINHGGDTIQERMTFLCYKEY